MIQYAHGSEDIIVEWLKVPQMADKVLGDSKVLEPQFPLEEVHLLKNQHLSEENYGIGSL